MELLSWSELIKVAPITGLVLACVYFGWFLRGSEVKALRDWIATITQMKN